MNDDEGNADYIRANQRCHTTLPETQENEPDNPFLNEVLFLNNKHYRRAYNHIRFSCPGLK
jgi:hypothetical protein